MDLVTSPIKPTVPSTDKSPIKEQHRNKARRLSRGRTNIRSFEQSLIEKAALEEEVNNNNIINKRKLSKKEADDNKNVEETEEYAEGQENITLQIQQREPDIDQLLINDSAKVMKILHEHAEAKSNSKMYSFFKSIDFDNSGFLDALEFENALKALNIHVEKETLKKLVSLFDSNDSGKVDIHEFFKEIKKEDRTSNFGTILSEDDIKKEIEASALAEASPTSRKFTTQECLMIIKNNVGLSNLRRSFAKWDSDSSGMISHQEFSEGLKKLNVVVSDDVCTDIIKQLDIHGKGQVDYNSFVNSLMEDDVLSGNFDPYVYHRSTAALPKGASAIPDKLDSLKSNKNILFLSELIQKDNVARHLPFNFHNARRLFQLLDTDNDEYISKDQLFDFLKVRIIGKNVQSSDVNKFIEICDSNKDGYIQLKDLYLTCRVLTDATNPNIDKKDFLRPHYHKKKHNKPSSSKHLSKNDNQNKLLSSRLSKLFVIEKVKGITRYDETEKKMWKVDTSHIIKPLDGPSKESDVRSWSSVYNSTINNGMRASQAIGNDDKNIKTNRIQAGAKILNNFLSNINNKIQNMNRKEDELQEKKWESLKHQTNRYTTAIAMNTSKVTLSNELKNKKIVSQISFLNM